MIPLPLASPASSSAAHLLRLRKLTLEWIGLDKGNICTRLGMAIPGGRIDTYQIPRHQLEVFQAQRRSTVYLLGPCLLRYIDGFLRAAVHRVMQGYLVQTVFIGRLYPHLYFLNRAGAIIARGPLDGHLRWAGLVGGDKVIL